MPLWTTAICKTAFIGLFLAPLLINNSKYQKGSMHDSRRVSPAGQRLEHLFINLISDEYQLPTDIRLCEYNACSFF